MKKLIALMLALTMALTLVACGGAKTETPAADAPAADTSAEASVEPPAEDAPVYKVGIVKFLEHASLNQIENNVQKELDAKAAELGVVFDYADFTFNGQGDGTTLNQIASQLISDDVDVIVPIATPAAQVVKSALESANADIPVVFSAVSDPVSAGLAETMDAPGGNMTGTSDALNTNTIMDLIFALDEEADYIGLLYSKSEDSSKQPIADAIAYLEAKGVKYIEKTGNTTDDILSAADALVAEGVDAIFTPTDNTVMNAEMSIAEKFTNAEIPHYTGADSFAVNGAFCGYGVDYANLGVATADMVVDILVNGADAGATAVQTFDNGTATVNTETCAAIGEDIEEVKADFESLCTDFVEVTSAREMEE